jgi:hypothetical protein
MAKDTTSTESTTRETISDPDATLEVQCISLSDADKQDLTVPKKSLENVR